MAMVNPYNYSKPNHAVGSRVQQTGAQSSKPEINNLGNKASNYLEQKIMSAKPEELTLMLYDGIIRFLSQVKLYNEQKNYEKSNNSNLRAQAILEELRATLNMEFELSHNLESLYIYMRDQLVDANYKKDNDLVDEVLALATDLRDTWKEAMGL